MSTFFDRFAQYAKSAFLEHWNLLAFGSGVAFSVLLPFSGVTMPLVCMGELLYLAYMVFDPRFQRVVDSGVNQLTVQEAKEAARQRLKQLLSGLDMDSYRRFINLKDKCASLTNDIPATTQVDSLHVQSVNKLLWMYAKLLKVRHGLDAFLENTDEKRLSRERRDAEKRLEELPETAMAKIRSSLEDMVETFRAREANYQKAMGNREYVELELQRIEVKLTTLSELAINRQDPSMLSDGVDAAARSVETTEQTLSDLGALSGFEVMENEEAPDIIELPNQVSCR